ncbi:hypothetical protein COLO4_28636 [Corchorus olitorius]|uniref:Uncharacterized protein n=1 Tax=Corchorus olitorius TaxID=93759 RepID=A0A1R3HJA1_9ROSI|nr:hypothetical protein COLO4_28636 [Corchorus olitorius]
MNNGMESESETRGRSGEEDDQLQRIDESKETPADGGDLNQRVGEGGDVVRENTVHPVAGDFGPWMIAQSHKPRKNLNPKPQSQVPVSAGDGTYGGSRFAALPTEGEDLNLDVDGDFNLERDRVVAAWANGVNKGESKAQKQVRNNPTVGPRRMNANGPVDLTSHDKGSSRDEELLENNWAGKGANKAQGRGQDRRPVRAQSYNGRAPPPGYASSSGEVQQDVSDGKYKKHTPGGNVSISPLDGDGVLSADVRNRHPPDALTNETVVVDSQLEDTIMEDDITRNLERGNNDVYMNDSHPGENVNLRLNSDY